jgi:hypothetical protein
MTSLSRIVLASEKLACYLSMPIFLSMTCSAGSNLSDPLETVVARLAGAEPSLSVGLPARYQPVAAIIEPFRCVPAIDPSLGASP